MSADSFKRAAALEASTYVLALEHAGAPYTLGLGTGSTAAFFVTEVGRLNAAGQLRHLRACASTSSETTARAQSLGLPLDAVTGLVTLLVDGADEISPELDLIKGGGGAMLRERAVANRSARRVFIADGTKRSPTLGSVARLPVEVSVSAVERELEWLRVLGARPRVRLTADGSPFTTDNGNRIIDCDYRPVGIADVAALAASLDARPDVKAHGLFIGMASEVIVVDASGLRWLHPRPPPAPRAPT